MHTEEPGQPERVPGAADGDEMPDPLICAACGAVVTSRRYAVERGGSHEHTFVNPAGIIWRIACFSRAGGCREAGSSTDEFTWFPGYRWKHALCAACGEHLGWSYGSVGHAGGPDAFWGLIPDKLAESRP